MKILTLFLLVSCLAAPAQTNIISFTNANGVFITNATARKIAENKLLYIISNGGGTVRLDSLPADIQAKFNYNPTNAAVADEADRQKHEAELERDRKYQIEADLAENRKKIESTKMMVEGKIIQKIDAGLLVDSAGERREESIQETIASGDNVTGGIIFWKKGLQVYDGLCLLTECPNGASLVDGDTVTEPAYPNGNYTYTTVNGSSKVVRRFTCDIASVFLTPDEKELKKIQATRPWSH